MGRWRAAGTLRSVVEITCCSGKKNGFRKETTQLVQRQPLAVKISSVSSQPSPPLIAKRLNTPPSTAAVVGYTFISNSFSLQQFL